MLFDDYSVSDTPDESGGGQSDIVISRCNVDVLHIEVKTMKKDVFWSEGEITKARNCEKDGIPYVIAVLSSDRKSNDVVDDKAVSDYQVRWIADPLARLRRHWDEKRVTVRWYWSEQSKNLQDVPENESWMVEPWTSPPPEYQPEKRPSRTSFVFHPQEDDYDGEGLEHVRSYLASDAQ